MMTIKINNPGAEEFLKKEFGNNSESLVQNFLEFVKLQKIRKEVALSLDELDRDEFVALDEAFQKATERYAS